MSTDRCVVAVIPARGGSKAIKGKNLAQLAGKPLLAYSIEHALSTPWVQRVLVSTDSREIAALAVSFGAEIIWRPAAISGDHASSESALIHALDVLAEEGSVQPDLVVFLQATSPLRRPDDVANAIAELDRVGADSLFSACVLPGFVWRADDGGPSPLNYDPARRPTRQVAPLDVFENGSIYLFKPWVLRECGSRLGGEIAVYMMDLVHSLQIDEPHDLQLMKLLMESFGGDGASPKVSSCRTAESPENGRR